jgi:hypothetical protein
MKPKKVKQSKKKKVTKAEKTYQAPNSLFKYTRRSVISFETIMSNLDSTCDKAQKEFKQALGILGTNFEKMSFSDLMDICVDYPEWIAFLEENDFISRELSYNGISCGDLFTVEGKQCILTSDGSDVNLVAIDGTYYTSDATSVNNPKSIKDLDNIYYIFGIDEGNAAELEKILMTRVPKGSFEIVVK